MRVATPILASALLGVFLPALAPAPATALTEFTIGHISAQLPDADGFLDGDSDPYIEVRVDGQLAGVTSIINGNNNPTWPGTTFTIQLNPSTSPFTTIELKAYDDDGGGLSDYLGRILIAYNWVAANAVSVSYSLSTTYPGTFHIAASLDATELPVPVQAKTWSSIKSLYR